MVPPVAADPDQHVKVIVGDPYARPTILGIKTAMIVGWCYCISGMCAIAASPLFCFVPAPVGAVLIVLGINEFIYANKTKV